MSQPSTPPTGKSAGAQAAMVAAVRRACLTSGFFYVRQHGVPDWLVDRQLAAARQLFDLPLADKERLAAARSPLHRGCCPHYTKQKITT
eukprot:835909-Prorocentrum_minimum.AAC.1